VALSVPRSFPFWPKERNHFSISSISLSANRWRCVGALGCKHIEIWIGIHASAISELQNGENIQILSPFAKRQRVFKMIRPFQANEFVANFERAKTLHRKKSKFRTDSLHFI